MAAIAPLEQISRSEDKVRAFVIKVFWSEFGWDGLLI
jgi:hypothetical protein